jgi:hypothetical protein
MEEEKMSHNPTPAQQPEAGLQIWLAEMESFLNTVRDEAQLSAALRGSAVNSGHALVKAREAWTRETERVEQLREQLHVVRQELQRLEKVVGTMYTALEEQEEWPPAARV